MQITSPGGTSVLLTEHHDCPDTCRSNPSKMGSIHTSRRKRMHVRIVRVLHMCAVSINLLNSCIFNSHEFINIFKRFLQTWINLIWNSNIRQFVIVFILYSIVRISLELWCELASRLAIPPTAFPRKWIKRRSRNIHSNILRTSPILTPR